jgi:hypothetical protein
MSLCRTDELLINSVISCNPSGVNCTVESASISLIS